MPVQKCPMCLETKEVISSHLIPAAIYEYCRSGDESPVRVGDGVVMHTDRHVQAPLLCSSCEQTLNRCGETWANPRFARLGGPFPLYEMITAVAPVVPDFYPTANNPAIDREKLTHFALGIFWKASVHSWRGGDKRPSIELGPYSDSIRRWLRGESGFPKHVCLSMNISRPDSAAIICRAPVETRLEGLRFFSFIVPGAIFILNTGKTIPDEIKALCFWSSAEHCIVVSDGITEQIWMRIGKDFHESRKSQGYLSAKDRRLKSRVAGG
jgi:hypothetical protein